MDIAQPGADTLTSKALPDLGRHVTPDLATSLGEALVGCMDRLSSTGIARVTRITSVMLGDYPEGAVLPDPDMMATLVVPVTGLSATAFVSFPPDQALALIPAWSSGPLRGEQALGCYRRGTRALAEAALGVFGLEADACDALE